MFPLAYYLGGILHSSIFLGDSILDKQFNVRDEMGESSWVLQLLVGPGAGKLVPI